MYPRNLILCVKLYKAISRHKRVVLALNQASRCSSPSATFHHTFQRHFQASSFPSSIILKKDDNNVKQMLEEFPEPKSIFLRVINEAYLSFQSHEIKPNITFQQISGRAQEKVWRATLSMVWPERFQVEGLASRKVDAEKVAYLYACQKIKDHGFLSEKNIPTLPKRLLIYSEEQIRNSKSILGNIFEIVWSKFGMRDLIPKYNTYEEKAIFGNQSYWKSELVLKYPEEMKFEGLGSRISEAENIAATKALYWLQEKGIINEKKRPVLYTAYEERKMIEFQKAPYPLYIPPELQSKMTEILEKTEVNSQLYYENEIVDNESVVKEEADILDVFTEKPYYKLSDEEKCDRNMKLFQQQFEIRQTSDPHLQKLRSACSQLPIVEKREEILQLLDENQVLVISGETGCGKSTQVPQYIFEHFVEQMKGSECNIVITQPRRISAISLAEYVAAERGENVGKTVGHQIRLNKILPEGNGAILFCSTGILLRKLCHNPTLEGVSHVIVDEVHERNIPIDFLLILLKNLLHANKNIKLLLMSASFNSSMFSRYFDNCPVLHIPGYVYPVKEYFLEDIAKNIQYFCEVSRAAKLDLDLVTKVIDYVDTTQPSGAILCFLPGWHEIKTVSSKLLSMFPDKSKYFICLVHSRLSHDEQKRIFTKPPQGVRKIILATNIAETSITIDDVVYVIDSGFHKGTSFDTERGTSTLGTKWITKANIRQRRGRAGRVQPGVCYHLFHRKFLTDLAEYPSPEMHNVPLEKVILDCKLYCPDAKAEDFLSLALQPPSSASIQAGIQELQIMGILDLEENLTSLGKVVVNFSTHPRLSKALVNAAFLKCVDPVLTICALQTVSQGPFTNNLEQKEEVKKIKEHFDDSIYSDHLALYKIYCEWNEHNKEEPNVEFNEKNMLDSELLTFAKQLKGLFAEHLYEAGLIKAVESYSNPEDECNKNSYDSSIVLAALASAFYPNVVKLIQGEISYGKLNPDVIIYSTLKGLKASPQKDSILHKEYDLPSPWLVYFSAMKCEARKLLMATELSCVSGVNLLLHCGQELELKKLSHPDQSLKDETTLVIDNSSKLQFLCTENEAQLLSKWRTLLQNFFQLYVEAIGNETFDKNSFLNATTTFDNEVLPVLKDILNSTQAPFTPGKRYFYRKNKLLSEDVEIKRI